MWEWMPIEFNSPLEEFRSDVSLTTWSSPEEFRPDLSPVPCPPPSSPGLYNFCFSHSQSEMVTANNSSDEEFPWSPSLIFSSVPEDESTCYGPLSRLELLTKLHDPWRFIEFTTFAFLIPPWELLHLSSRLCLMNLTTVKMNGPEMDLYLSRFHAESYVCNYFPRKFKLRPRYLPRQFHIFMNHTVTVRRLISRDAYKLCFPCLRELAIGFMLSKRVYLIKTKQFVWRFRYIPIQEAVRHEPMNFANGGAIGTLEQSHDAVSGTTIAERHGRRRKCEVAGGTSSGNLNVDWNIEPDCRHEYDVLQSEPCSSSLMSLLASKTSTRRLLNDLLVRLRSISWFAGDLSDLELTMSYQLRSMWNSYVTSFMLGPCYPQNTTNRLLFEFTFILYSQIDFLLFQASMLQKNIPLDMTAEMIVGVKEFEVLDVMLEAILNVQPMFEEACTRPITGEAVKAWLKEVIHIFHETLGLLTDCRTEIKKLHIERIHDCSRCHWEDIPCWYFNFKPVSISNKFHEILILSKRLIKVNHLFLNFSEGYLVEPHDLIFDHKRTPRFSRQVMMTMTPSSLEQSLTEDKDDLTKWDVGSPNESHGDVVKPHDDLTLQSIRTPEIVMEMQASDLLEKLTREEAIDKAGSSQSLAAIIVADKQCKRKRSSKKRERPTELITDVNVLVPYSNSTEQVAADSLRECSSRNQASSNPSLAANTVADKQCKRQRSSKKGGRPTELITDVNVLVPYSSSTEQVEADGLHECSSHKQASLNQSLAANTVADEQRKRKRSSKKGGRPSQLITDVNVLLPYSSWTLQATADHFDMGKSTLKRSCRKLGIKDWSKLKDIIVSAEARTSAQPSLTTSPPKKAKMQDARPVIVKATYEGDTAKLNLFSSSKKVDLDEQLARKLKLEVGSFKVKHLDKDNEEILVSTDSDFEDCIETSESQGNTTIRLRVEPIRTCPYCI